MDVSTTAQLETAETLSADFAIAGVATTVRAPQSIMSILERTLAPARTPSAPADPPVAITVTNDRFVWRIDGGSQGSGKVLSGTSALPQVAGAATSSLIADVADHAKLTVWRAAVVERDGHAIAFVGDDWESGLVLACHLHARGWRLLGGDYALIERDTLTVRPTRKQLYATLSIMDELPNAYRRAVEVSPWYSTPHGLAFYAVDPALVHSTSPWAESGRLRAVIKLDGNTAEFPSLERAESFKLAGGITSDELERESVAIAELQLGDYALTADLVQRWFSSLVSGEGR
jgi:hypothetical protein